MTVTVTGTVIRTEADLSSQGHAQTVTGFRTVSVPRFAADVLGRAGSGVTAKHYVQRAAVAVAPTCQGLRD